jgi:hypothetical protein
VPAPGTRATVTRTGLTVITRKSQKDPASSTLRGSFSRTTETKVRICTYVHAATRRMSSTADVGLRCLCRLVHATLATDTCPIPRMMARKSCLCAHPEPVRSPVFSQRRRFKLRIFLPSATCPRAPSATCPRAPSATCPRAPLYSSCSWGC